MCTCTLNDTWCIDVRVTTIKRSRDSWLKVTLDQRTNPVCLPLARSCFFYVTHLTCNLFKFGARKSVIFYPMARYHSFHNHKLPKYHFSTFFSRSLLWCEIYHCVYIVHMHRSQITNLCTAHPSDILCVTCAKLADQF